MSDNIFDEVDFLNITKIMFFIVVIIAIIIFGITIKNVLKSARKDKNNKKAPTIVTEAKVITKRSQNIFMKDVAGSTIYYVTFQVVGGDRIELNLSGQDYGMLAEGDCGKLSFKGTSFIDFIRN